MSQDKCEKKCKMTSIGGQALIEGIMMKGPHRTVMATRLPDQTIDLEELPEKHLKDKLKFLGWPFIRGIFNLIDSFVIGYKALMKSAEKSGLDDEDKDDLQNSRLYRIFGDKFMSVLTIFASILGVAIAVLLFLFLPTVLFNLLNITFTDGSSFSTANIFKGFTGGELQQFKGLIEGLLKILIFISYVAATSLMKDIHRTYQYHGAEHKSIFCYEKGLDLTVENVKIQSRFHPRCGTSFLILVLIISILISTLTIFFFPNVTSISWLWMIIKILLLPVICGCGYELIRLCGRHPNAFTRAISAPGVLVQHLTTKEPDDDMIEVAIEALTAVIPENRDDDEWGK